MDGCAGFASNGLTHGDRRSPQGRQNANYFDRSTYNCRFWWISNGTRHWLLRWRGARADFADRYHPVAIASDLSEKTRQKIGRNLRGLPQADAVPAFFVVEAARQLLVGFRLTDRAEAMDLSLNASALIAAHPS